VHIYEERFALLFYLDVYTEPARFGFEEQKGHCVGGAQWRKAYGLDGIQLIQLASYALFNFLINFIFLYHSN